MKVLNDAENLKSVEQIADVSTVGAWVEVSSMSDIDEEDTTGVNILKNDSSLCKKLEEDAKSFLKQTKKLEFQ